ncbi:LrgB family protein [Rhodocyclus tenuis]|uniref:LrgB family protein n=1 Tax=Rhodocyclus gracilis TaxID=2929842 RepID=A0ABX0WK55_9RHOO|nr:LrgB family protein [Rhodocyclus gracilis]MRD73190.1 LrgB family protein [Rhodocyclus gracilis]NJA89029.1 LrgB family protein [Rhodocyclus gracilis]
MDASLIEGPAHDIWVYLSAQPLLWLTLTLVAYALAFAVQRRLHGNPAANPVLIAVALLSIILLLTDTPYASYFGGAQFVHFLLGPATVALAVPLYGQRQRIVAQAGPIFIALVVGSLAAALSACLIAATLGATPATIASLAPKSVTTPIAMGISERIGGLASLTAVIVIITGILGAVMGSGVLRRLGVRDDASIGFALGLAAHGIGSARALQISEEAGAFAALAMGLGGTFAALTLPWLMPPLQRLLAAQ